MDAQICQFSPFKRGAICLGLCLCLLISLAGNLSGQNRHIDVIIPTPYLGDSLLYNLPLLGMLMEGPDAYNANPAKKTHFRIWTSHAKSFYAPPGLPITFISIPQILANAISDDLKNLPVADVHNYLKVFNGANEQHLSLQSSNKIYFATGRLDNTPSGGNIWLINELKKQLAKETGVSPLIVPFGVSLAQSYPNINNYRRALMGLAEVYDAMFAKQLTTLDELSYFRAIGASFLLPPNSHLMVNNYLASTFKNRESLPLMLVNFSSGKASTDFISNQFAAQMIGDIVSRYSERANIVVTSPSHAVLGDTKSHRTILNQKFYQPLSALKRQHHFTVLPDDSLESGLLAALVRKAKINIGVDTGLTHLFYALNPTLRQFTFFKVTDVFNDLTSSHWNPPNSLAYNVFHSDSDSGLANLERDQMFRELQEAVESRLDPLSGEKRFSLKPLNCRRLNHSYNSQ